MTSLSEKGQLYLELYAAITHFMGRQQLVVRAVVDQGVSPQDLRRGVAGWHDKTPQRGSWGEWRFLFHGAGCRLTDPHTGEVIEWNGPDTDAFDPYFFIEHLAWRLKRTSSLPSLSQFAEDHGMDQIMNLISDLVADGILSTEYQLTPQVDATQSSAA